MVTDTPCREVGSVPFTISLACQVYVRCERFVPKMETQCPTRFRAGSCRVDHGGDRARRLRALHHQRHRNRPGADAGSAAAIVTVVV